MTVYAIPEKYARPVDRNSSQLQCIAPTQKGRRCLYDASATTTAEAAQREAVLLPRGSLRDEWIALFLVSSCCVVHKHRLEDQEECLISLVKIYGETMGAAPAISTLEASFSQLSLTVPLVQPGRDGKSSGGWQSPTDLAEIALNGDEHATTMSNNGLRLRLRGSRPNSEKSHIFREYFPIYQKTVESQLLSPEKDKHASYSKGKVYCFNVPTQNEYVKIGFTSKSTAMRIEEWRDCYPSATMLHEVNVAWPWHIEQLVHLELAGRRRQIRCHFCTKYHNEWFELEYHTAINVINLWVELVTKWSLFDSSTGKLTDIWKAKAREIQGQITAAKLLEKAMVTTTTAKDVNGTCLGKTFSESGAQNKVPGTSVVRIRKRVGSQERQSRPAVMAARGNQQKDPVPSSMAEDVSHDTQDMILKAFSEFFILLQGQQQQQQQIKSRSDLAPQTLKLVM